MTSTRFFINSAHENSKEYNYQSIKIWNNYYEMVSDTREGIQLACEIFPQSKSNFDYELKPITVLYENGYSKTSSAAFASMGNDLGEVKKGTPYLSIPHIEKMKTYSREQQDEWYKVNLSHEWAHWAMFLALGRLAGGGYFEHTGYNADVQMSYKEGWAVFHANRYAYGYNWNWLLDNSLQSGSKKYTDCFGKSTNWTVNSVLRDIYDKESPRESEDQYDLAKDWKPTIANDHEARKKLSNGLMFVIMAKSKARTLEEYIGYMKANGFVKDLESFDKVLSLNGLDSLGRFTLDRDGTRINY